jgi:hypothetical protein
VLCNDGLERPLLIKPMTFNSHERTDAPAARPMRPSVFIGLLFGWISASAQTYTFTTLAGTPSAGYADGTGSAARFGSPQGVAVDGNGNIYVSDTGNFIIRKMTPKGVVTTFAGQAGQRGNDDGIGGNARFNHPRSIAVDGTGTVYVADQNTIRRLSPD